MNKNKFVLIVGFHPTYILKEGYKILSSKHKINAIDEEVIIKIEKYEG